MIKIKRNFVGTRIGKGTVEATLHYDSRASITLTFRPIPAEPERSVTLHATADIVHLLKFNRAELMFRLCRIAIAQAQKQLVRSWFVEEATVNLDITIKPWNGDLVEAPYYLG